LRSAAWLIGLVAASEIVRLLNPLGRGRAISNWTTRRTGAKTSRLWSFSPWAQRNLRRASGRGFRTQLSAERTALAISGLLRIRFGRSLQPRSPALL